MTTNIEEILMQDEEFRKHILEIYPPRFNLPKKRDYPQEIKGNKYLVSAVTWLEGNLQLSLIRDDFELGCAKEDELRNMWQTELGKKYEKEGLDKEVLAFLNKNKLKGNCYGKNFVSAIGILEGCLEEISKKVKQEIAKSKELIYSMGPAFCNYKQMSLGQRIRFIRKAEERVYEILKSISVKE